VKQNAPQEKQKEVIEGSTLNQTLLVPNIDIDMKSELSSSSELEELPHEHIEVPFIINEKFAKRMLVFKKH